MTKITDGTKAVLTVRPPQSPRFRFPGAPTAAPAKARCAWALFARMPATSLRTASGRLNSCPDTLMALSRAANSGGGNRVFTGTASTLGRPLPRFFIF
jgi:hypothetical protein